PLGAASRYPAEGSGTDGAALPAPPPVRADGRGGAGTHGRANGHDAVLDAAAVLKARARDDLKLVLVGDGALKARLVERASLERMDNVVFHPLVPKTRLVGLLREADIGIQCLSNVPAFYRGTSPNKFFDYIACGLPVLNNYPGG